MSGLIPNNANKSGVLIKKQLGTNRDPIAKRLEGYLSSGFPNYTGNRLVQSWLTECESTLFIYLNCVFSP